MSNGQPVVIAGTDTPHSEHSHQSSAQPYVPQYAMQQAAQMPVQTLPQVKKKGSRWGGIILIFLFILLPIFVCCGVFYVIFYSETGKTVASQDLSYSYVYGDEKSENKLLSIKINAQILSEGESSSGLSALLTGQYVYGYAIKKELMKAVKDPSIKGVILEINSPGGTVVGSNAISDGVAYYKEKTNKPVYAYVQDLAASGAYWSASATDKIIADSGSLVGSIGVIFGPFEYYDKVVSLNSVVTENGITETYITGGTYKDFGNPFRKITDDEMSVMQHEINIEYENFVTHVSTHRGIAKDVIKKDIKSLVYGVTTAKQYGLIDEVGNREYSYDSLAKAANIGSDYQVVRENVAGGFFSSLFAKSNSQPVAASTKCVLCGQLLYLYGDPRQYLQ